MTVADIIERVRQIVQQTSSTNSQVSDATLIDWINEATLQICSMLSTLPKESVAGITAASSITLGSDVLRVDYAAISDGTTKFPLATTDFNSFVRDNPNWENASTGKPSTLVRMTDTSWKMYPAPDATWTGKAVSIYGSVLPDDLTSTTESPAVSVTLHRAYPHFCAWLFFLTLNNPERATAEYNIFEALVRKNTKTATATSGSMLSFKMGL